MKFLLFIFVFCTVIVGHAQQKPKATPDSVQVKSNILSFYKWYNKNWRRLAAFELYKSKKGKKGPPYIINWKEAEASFTYLRNQAPFLSKAFIESERQAFKNIDAEFVKYPEDEVPAGFDYDRFTHTQEDTKWFWQELNKKTNKWAIDFGGDEANVVVTDREADKGQYIFCGKLLKEKGRWMIAKLSCDPTPETKDLK